MLLRASYAVKFRLVTCFGAILGAQTHYRLGGARSFAFARSPRREQRWERLGTAVVGCRRQADRRGAGLAQPSAEEKDEGELVVVEIEVHSIQATGVHMRNATEKWDGGKATAWHPLAFSE